MENNKNDVSHFFYIFYKGSESNHTLSTIGNETTVHILDGTVTSSLTKCSQCNHIVSFASDMSVSI